MGHLLSPVSLTVDKLSNTNSFVFLRNSYLWLTWSQAFLWPLTAADHCPHNIYCISSSLLCNSTDLILQRDRGVEGLQKSGHDLILIMLLLLKKCPELPRKCTQDFGNGCRNPLFHALSTESDYSFYSVEQAHNRFAEEETDNLVYCILSCSSFMAPFWFPRVWLCLFTLEWMGAPIKYKWY